MSVKKRTASLFLVAALGTAGLGAASTAASAQTALAPCTGKSGLHIKDKGETGGKAWADVLNCGSTRLVTLDINNGPDPLCRTITKGNWARITAPTIFGSVRKAKYC
ncbi:hypothetical protein ACWGH8_19120 [Nonomuraea muscovyensis]|uniref:hypothetical protein n=1 Tax=Nonomuraea muscovyensis TaxID=1124761 RepID=UPI0033E64805|nr:hypothetical protein [Nonomuraea muscovyensis]